MYKVENENENETEGVWRPCKEKKKHFAIMCSIDSICVSEVSLSEMMMIEM